jgi:2-keto-3-deoxy-galactonokinase
MVIIFFLPLPTGLWYPLPLTHPFINCLSLDSLEKFLSFFLFFSAAKSFKTQMSIALVDWGTTSLRVYSFSGGTAIPNLVHEDPCGGILSVPPNGFEEAFEAALKLCGPVFSAQSPAVLCGMVGSSLGWKEVPYVTTPASLAAVAAGCVSFSTSTGRSITIVPGVKCSMNVNGQPDVMRGEETQVFGELLEVRGTPPHAPGDLRVFCLPGTHSKWVVCRGGCVESLQTAMTGELFALLSKHSVLAASLAPTPPATSAFAGGAGEGAADALEAQALLAQAEAEAFEEGLACAAPLHALFSVRPRDLFSGGGQAQVPVRAGNRGWLSGALLALELREAAEWIGGVAAASAAAAVVPSSISASSTDSSSAISPTPTVIPVCVVGAGPLAERYALAMSLKGMGGGQKQQQQLHKSITVAAPHAAARGLALLAGMLGVQKKE